MMAIDEISRKVDTFLTSKLSEVRSVSRSILENPELCYKEYKSHSTLTLFLSSNGFTVTPNFFLDTAFKAEYDSGRPGPCVGLLSEYDALPEVGHACGHNLIAVNGIAAALCIKHILENNLSVGGKIVVVGTPAEEGGGGKIELLNGTDVFETMDICLMAHPSPVGSDANNGSFGSLVLTATFSGEPSHAAAFPWQGVNALDAAVTAYNGFAMLRQQCRPDWRLHCIFPEAGYKVNIIPERSVLEVMVRTMKLSDMRLLLEKVVNILKSASMATGCSLDVVSGPQYYNLLVNRPLADVYERFASKEGVDFTKSDRLIEASTDMGNVTHKRTQQVPGIHPWFSINTEAANHTRGFTDKAGTDEAFSLTMKSTKAMALTCLEVMTNPQLLDRVKGHHGRFLEGAPTSEMAFRPFTFP